VDVRTVAYKTLTSRNRPSFYADPLAWAVADFIAPFMEGRSGPEAVATGLIVVSNVCSLRTIRALSDTAKRGSISPLRFAGASPSITAGLAALCYGLRGPTITLTMRPGAAQAAVSAQVRYWFSYSRIIAAILVAHHDAEGFGDVLKGAMVDSRDQHIEHAVHGICDTPMASIL